MTPLHRTLILPLLCFSMALIHFGCDANNASKTGQVSEQPSDDELPLVSEVGADLPPQTGPQPSRATQTVRTILEGDAVRVQHYLDAGVNVNEQDVNGYTLLHHAVDTQQYEIARLLVERGANVNLKARLDLTPLHFAARRGRVDIARLLVEAGAEINPRGAAGNQYTPTRIASQLGHYELVEYLQSVGGRQ